MGDLLVVRNEFTGEIAHKPVTELLRYENRQFYELELIDQQGQSTLLDVTDDHPFWVENIGWVDSDNLEPGMLVMDLGGSWHGVKSMLPVDREGLAYNFEVGDFHTYFVGESDVWVHNCPEGPKGEKSLEQQAKDIRHKLNKDKPTVTIKTEHNGEHLHFDLTGPSHRGIPTPHKQISKSNTGSDGVTRYNKDRSASGTTSMSQREIRTVRRYLEKQD